MNPFRRPMAVSVITAWILIVAPSAAVASDISVPQDHPTIQDAIDAASPGDRILVGRGTYGPIVVAQSGLTIEAVRGRAVIVGGDAGSAVSILGTGVVFRGFDVSGGGLGIDVSGSGARVEGNRVSGASVGIQITGSANVVSGNRCTNNFQGLIMLLFATGNQVLDNRCEDNNFNGFISLLCGGNLWQGNVAKRNGQGFLIQSGPLFGFGDVFVDNQAKDNQFDGFGLQVGTANTLIGNMAVNNGGSGFATYSPAAVSNTYLDNFSNENGGFGFSDVTIGSGTQGTGNTYAGNKCEANGLGASDPEGLCD